jgi:hypothetical protein
MLLGITCPPPAYGSRRSKGSSQAKVFEVARSCQQNAPLHQTAVPCATRTAATAEAPVFAPASPRAAPEPPVRRPSEDSAAFEPLLAAGSSAPGSRQSSLPVATPALPQRFAIARAAGGLTQLFAAAPAPVQPAGKEGAHLPARASARRASPRCTLSPPCSDTEGSLPDLTAAISMGIRDERRCVARAASQTSSPAAAAQAPAGAIPIGISRERQPVAGKATPTIVPTQPFNWRDPVSMAVPMEEARRAAALVDAHCYRMIVGKPWKQP